MSNKQAFERMLRQEEAVALAKSAPDKRVGALLRFGLTTVLAGRGMRPGVQPQADFDLYFFAEALRAMGENRDALLRILQGDGSAMEWWPDDEDPLE